MENSTRLVLATAAGIAICERVADGWRQSKRDLTGSHVTSIIAQGDVILAGTQDGIFRSEDGGDSWGAVDEGLSIRHIRWLAADPDAPQRVFAGSEPAGIFLSTDGGLTWASRPEVEQLRDSLGWFLPYSPEAGCVRGFAFSGTRGYAAVEVGGPLLSNDGGGTWALTGTENAPGSNIHPDVHSITIHPESADLVAAPTGGGFYLSEDGGTSWENRYDDCYCRAMWWDAANPQHMLLGAAEWVDRNGRIEETFDGGRTWRESGIGLELPWNRHMVERFFQVGDYLLAILSNGDLLMTALESFQWRPLLPEVQEVSAVAALAKKVEV
jgi:photosystem II stability/assembly factor-like uncharacterized protein